MSNTQPLLLRFWLSTSGTFIRIEWDHHSAELDSNSRVTHSTAPVPECLRLAARDCLFAAGEHDVPGCEYMGTESSEEMFWQIAGRCCACGLVSAGACCEVAA
jgi:hypothetical protein